MIGNLHHELCKVAVAQICKQLQWDSVKQSALEVLSDLLEKFMTKVGQLSLELAFISNRTQPIFDDVVLALQLIRTDFNELDEFVRHYRTIPFKYSVDSLTELPSSSRLLQPWESESASEESEAEDVSVTNDEMAVDSIKDQNLDFFPAEVSTKKPLHGSLGRRFSTTHAVRPYRGLPKLSRLGSAYCAEKPVEVSEVDVKQQEEVFEQEEGTAEQSETDVNKFRFKFRIPILPAVPPAKPTEPLPTKPEELVDVNFVEEDVAVFRPIAESAPSFTVENEVEMQNQGIEMRLVEQESFEETGVRVKTEEEIVVVSADRVGSAMSTSDVGLVEPAHSPVILEEAIELKEEEVIIPPPAPTERFEHHGHHHHHHHHEKHVHVSKDICTIDESAVQEIQHSTPIANFPAYSSGNESSQETTTTAPSLGHRLSLKIRFKPISEAASPAPAPPPPPVEEPPEIQPCEKTLDSSVSNVSEPPVAEISSDMERLNESEPAAETSGTVAEEQPVPSEVLIDSAEPSAEPWYPPESPKAQMAPSPPPFQLSPPEIPFRFSPPEPEHPFKLSPPTPPPAQPEPAAAPPLKLGFGLKLKIKLPVAPPPIPEPVALPPIIEPAQSPQFFERHSQSDWSDHSAESPFALSFGSGEASTSGKGAKGSKGSRKRKQPSSIGSGAKKRAFDLEVGHTLGK